MVELVMKPYVAVCAATSIFSEIVHDFAHEHGMDSLVNEPGEPTPISSLLRKIDGYERPADGDKYSDDDPRHNYSHLDLLAEFAGRFCYRSFGKGRSTEEYLKNIIEERHGNVLAHASISFIVTGVSRSLSHELVRHHVGCNPSQESQRFVTAEEGTIEVTGYRSTRAIVPPLLVALNDSAALDTFRQEYLDDVRRYNGWVARYAEKLNAVTGNLDFDTMRKKRILEAARAKLPNAAETRLVWTMNMRAARHVIERRGDIHADLEIRRLAVEFARQLKVWAPLSFYDVEIYTAADGFEAVRVANIGV